MTRPLITGNTALLGVIGYPVQHSLSPTMHNAALQELGLDWVYLPFPVPPAQLAAAVAGFAAMGVRGFNVTIPHKQAILAYLSEVSPLARTVGAVNTVKWTETGWSGTNTDIVGFLAPLRDRDWAGAVAVVLGSGGAARAVVAGCADLGFGEIWVVGRDPDKLTQFVASWPSLKGLRAVPWSELRPLLAQADLLVNTTPLGMHPQAKTSPVTGQDLDQVQKALVYDLVYAPRLTQLLQQARARGLRTQDGLSMLVQQGAAALSWWTGQPAPAATMERAVLEFLGGG